MLLDSITYSYGSMLKKTIFESLNYLPFLCSFYYFFLWIIVQHGVQLSPLLSGNANSLVVCSYFS